MAKSVGSLHVDILARVDTLERDLAKARAMIDGTDKQIRKAGEGAAAAYKSFSLFNSFQGRGMTGIVADMTALTFAVSAVKNELKYVYDNIEKIPGISPEAIASVNELKVNLHAAANTVHQLVATGMNWFLNFGKAIGVGAASLMGFNAQAPIALESMDKIREANDPGYWDKVAKARADLATARKAENVALDHQAGKYHELMLQAQQYDLFSKGSSRSTLDRLEAEKKATDARKQANSVYIEVENRYITAQRRRAIEDLKESMENTTQLERIKMLKKEINELSGQMPLFWNPDDKEADIAAREKILILQPQIIAYEKQLRGEFEKIKTPAREFSDVFIGSFQKVDEYLTSFITRGKMKFSDYLLDLSNQIISTFLKLAIINPLINALFGGGIGGALLPALFGPGATKGRADGGHADGWTLVGERGPELVNMGSGSFVLPASESRAKLAGGGGNTYVIDARGADTGIADRLERMLLQLAGPGVVEQRALAAGTNARWRRQG